MRIIGRFLLAAGLLLGGVAAWAQAGAATGSISGVVHDPQGKVIPGAKITVRSTDLSATRVTTSDANGHFSVSLLPPAGYTVQAESNGLRLARAQAVTLGINTAVHLNLKLALVAASQQVTVTGGRGTREGQTVAPPVDKESPVASNAIAGLTVTYLPNRDRDFSQFGDLAADAQASADGNGIDIDGQRSTATQTEVDGAAFNDALEGGRRGSNDGGFLFPQTAVREFQIVHSGADADVGDTNGGFLNIATKEGSNTVRGEQFYIFRPSGLTANDAFGHSLDNVQNEIGGSLGGAIRKDKVFFYAGGEQDFLKAPFYTAFQPQASGVAVPAGLTAQQTQQVGHVDPTALSLRLDFVLSAHNLLNFQTGYNRISNSLVNNNTTQTDAAPSAGDRLDGQSDWLRLNLTTQAASDTVNQLLAQWGGDRRDFSPLSAAPEYAVSGFGILGGDSLGLHRYTSDTRGLSDDVAINWRSQQIHVGAALGYDPAIEQHEANLNGRYDYASLASYLAGTPRRFQQTFYAPGGDPLYQGTEKTLGLYVNDRTTLATGLTLTAGLRWDAQWNPQPGVTNPTLAAYEHITSDLSQIQPRLGLAWEAGPKTVVRVSSGLYDAPTPATYFQRVFTDNGLNTVVADSAYDPQVLALASGAGFPGLTAIPAGLTTPAALAYGMAPNFRNPRSMQSAASVLQQFGRRVDLAVGYTHNSTWDLQRTVNANLFAPTGSSNGNPVFGATRPLPSVGQLLENQSSAHSSYDGANATTTLRLPYNLTLVGNYTLAHTRDDASEQGPFGLTTALNPFNLAAEAGNANQDVRHSFNLSGTDNLPWGLKVNPVFIARSGLPYTPIIGLDTQNDGNDFNDRALVNGALAPRNSLRQPAFYNLDLRFVKDVTLKGKGHHLDLFADVFNVTNAGNRNFGPDAVNAFGTPGAPVYSAGLPLYAPATTGFGGARQVQFTVRLVGF